jgi:hypothetical protein
MASAAQLAMANEDLREEIADSIRRDLPVPDTRTVIMKEAIRIKMGIQKMHGTFGPTKEMSKERQMHG